MRLRSDNCIVIVEARRNCLGQDGAGVDRFGMVPARQKSQRPTSRQG